MRCKLGLNLVVLNGEPLIVETWTLELGILVTGAVLSNILFGKRRGSSARTLKPRSSTPVVPTFKSLWQNHRLICLCTAPVPTLATSHIWAINYHVFRISNFMKLRLHFLFEIYFERELSPSNTGEMTPFLFPPITRIERPRLLPNCCAENQTPHDMTRWRKKLDVDRRRRIE